MKIFFQNSKAKQINFEKLFVFTILNQYIHYKTQKHNYLQKSN